ncbi:thiamine-phosphate kinase [Oryzobacter telluris]|uniref:thiamine-phosphate kinase n=1 Tax=Oryzobacter telluris TaxID=3149179 RepID=UPI00370D4911
MRLREVSEGELLARVFPVYARASAPSWGSVPVGPGDDAAVVGAPSGTVVATTDSMVRVRDWRDEWSSAHDVGVKVATQNLADVAAMGASPTALLVSLVADPELDVGWAVDLARGIASVAEAASAPVVGGDLSSGPPGVVVVTVTALGDLRGRPPVLRSGALVGDVVAVCGSLGLSGGGLALYLAGEADPDRSGPGVALDERGLAVRALMRHHRAPVAPWWAGPEAAQAGAHALVDVSDGLVTDLGRVAAASGVAVDLDGAVLRDRYAAGPLALALGAEAALHQVLAGGEEHALVGTFADAASLPVGGEEAWHVIGRVVAAGGDGPRVTVDGVVADARGWDHFAQHPSSSAPGRGDVRP